LNILIFLFWICFSFFSGLFIFFLPELKDFFLIHNDILTSIEGFGVYPVIILCILFSLISIILKNTKFTSLFLLIGMISYYFNNMEITLEYNTVVFILFLIAIFFVRYIIRIPSKIFAFIIPIVFVVGEIGLFYYYKEQLAENIQKILNIITTFFIGITGDFAIYINSIFIFLSAIVFFGLLMIFNKKQTVYYNVFLINSILSLGIILTVFVLKKIDISHSSFFYNIGILVVLSHLFLASLTCSPDHYTGKHLEKERKKLDKIKKKEKEKEESSRQNIVISPEVLLVDFDFISSKSNNIIYHVPIKIIFMLESIRDTELRHNVSQAVTFLKNYKGINLKFSTATRSLIPTELDSESEEGAVFAIAMKLNKLGQKAKILTTDMTKHKIAANNDIDLILYADFINSNL